jgi:hypothetical protein
MTTPTPSDAQIDDILDEAHRKAVAAGITNGGMVGQLWNHIAARAIERALQPDSVHQGSDCVVGVEPLDARTAAYRDALVWALGAHETDGFRERCVNEDAYWWRTELRERAGLKWDGEKFVDRAPGSDTSGQPDGAKGESAAAERPHGVLGTLGQDEQTGCECANCANGYGRCQNANAIQPAAPIPPDGGTAP